MRRPRSMFLSFGVLWAGAATAFAQVEAAPLRPTGDKTQAAQAQDETPKPRADIYDPAADGRKQIDAAIATAKKENRRVLIQWGANWCGWCHLLHDVFEKDQAVARKLMYEYDVVLVDIGKWDKHLDLAKEYNADFKSSGVPYLTVLDADGKVLANQETGSLENGPKHDPAKVLAFLEKHQAPYLSAESVLSDGISAAKKDGRLVFLHFGAPWCGWCHKLEDWMAREEIAKVLEKHFVDVKIDTDRTIGGQDLMARFTEGKGGGIPWFAVLDASGEVVVTGAPGGKNIGFPYTDEEIAAFGQVLAKTQRFSKEEIAGLLKSLSEGREASGTP